MRRTYVDGHRIRNADAEVWKQPLWDGLMHHIVVVKVPWWRFLLADLREWFVDRRRR